MVNAMIASTPRREQAGSGLRRPRTPEGGQHHDYGILRLAGARHVRLAKTASTASMPWSCARRFSPTVGRWRSRFTNLLAEAPDVVAIGFVQLGQAVVEELLEQLVGRSLALAAQVAHDGTDVALDHPPAQRLQSFVNDDPSFSDLGLARAPVVLSLNLQMVDVESWAPAAAAASTSVSRARPGRSPAALRPAGPRRRQVPARARALR